MKLQTNKSYKIKNSNNFISLKKINGDKLEVRYFGKYTAGRGPIVSISREDFLNQIAN